jgi:predicted nucleic acid-binding protein
VERAIVVDASVSVKWFNTNEILALQARALLQDSLFGQIVLHAPEIWLYEVTQTINRAMNRRDMTEAEGRSAIQQLERSGVLIHPNASHEDAFNFARNHGTQVYDSLYLMLAQQRGYGFWTADERVKQTLDSTLSFIPWIGNYPVVNGETDSTG